MQVGHREAGRVSALTSGKSATETIDEVNLLRHSEAVETIAEVEHDAQKRSVKDFLRKSVYFLRKYFLS